MISCRTRIQSLDYCTHITKYAGIHESCKDMNKNSLDNEKNGQKLNVKVKSNSKEILF